MRLASAGSCVCACTGSRQIAPFILHKETKPSESAMQFNGKEPKKSWLSNDTEDENWGERSPLSTPFCLGRQQSLKSTLSSANTPGAPSFCPLDIFSSIPPRSWAPVPHAFASSHDSVTTEQILTLVLTFFQNVHIFPFS